MDYHKEILKYWPDLHFCDTSQEKLEHIQNTVAYLISKNMADDRWRPIMIKRVIELSKFYLYINTLLNRLQGIPIIYKQLP